MPEYDNTNTLVIFQNDQKGNDKAPTLTGKVNVEGVEYPVALWTRTATSSGNKFWSGKVEVDKAEGAPVPVAAGESSDDIPF